MNTHIYDLQHALLERWEQQKLSKTYRSTFLSYLDQLSITEAKSVMSLETYRL